MDKVAAADIAVFLYTFIAYIAEVIVRFGSEMADTVAAVGLSSLTDQTETAVIAEFFGVCTLSAVVAEVFVVAGRLGTPVVAVAVIILAAARAHAAFAG